MYKRLSHLFIYIGAISGLTACSDSWDDQYTDKTFETVTNVRLAVDTEQMDFDDKAGTRQFSISAAGMWTLRTSQAWVKTDVEKGHGSATISVSVDANTSTTQGREATITIANGVQTRTVKVRQTNMEEILAVGKSDFEYGYLGGTGSTSVNANVGWTLTSSAAWLTVSKNADGQGFTLTAQENISTAERRATVTVKGVTLSREVSIRQTGVRQPEVQALTVVGTPDKHEAALTLKAASADLEVTEYGICYSSTAAEPDKSNATVVQRTANQKSISDTFQLTALKSKTTYTARPYIVTALGTLYGPARQFTTKASVPGEGDNGTPKD